MITWIKELLLRALSPQNLVAMDMRPFTTSP